MAKIFGSKLEKLNLGANEIGTQGVEILEILAEIAGSVPSTRGAESIL